ncbi:MAG TPA: hypothetical protein VK489_05960, partial [Ferruginibacter sp.]|nr:hypothetical protein [Ferruginibacter sp.]
MQQDNNNIENKLRQLENQQLPDLSHMDEHWQEMNLMLGQNAPVPPKKRFWKKITRRTITYMGVAAVVITTSYYAVKYSAKKEAFKKTTPGVAIKKTSTQQKIVLPQQVPVKSKPVLRYNQNHNMVTKIREESDTVFLNQVKPAVVADGSSTGLSSIEHFYSNLKQPVQQFEIDPARDTTLLGRQGTKLTIPANAFVYPDRKPITTTVRITLTECYEYTDMLAYRLHTVSDDKQLVTGGMINIKAVDKDNISLKLLNYKPVGVSMPAKKYDPDMQLFVNNPGGTPTIKTYDTIYQPIGLETPINWRAAG